MSKKRKTRKQKEQSKTRNISNSENKTSEEKTQSITYSVSTSTSSAGKPKKETPKVSIPKEESLLLKKDLASIVAASGIIVSVNILLAVLLTSGVVKINFLGY